MTQRHPSVSSPDARGGRCKVIADNTYDDTWIGKSDGRRLKLQEVVGHVPAGQPTTLLRMDRGQHAGAHGLLKTRGNNPSRGVAERNGPVGRGLASRSIHAILSLPIGEHRHVLAIERRRRPLARKQVTVKTDQRASRTWRGGSAQGS